MEASSVTCVWRSDCARRLETVARVDLHARASRWRHRLRETDQAAGRRDEVVTNNRFGCGKCPMTFRTQGALNGHQRLHKRSNEVVTNNSAVETPEDCCLVAHDTGDGWALAVEDTSHEIIAYLTWPSSFGESQTAAELQSKGFIIV